MTIEELTEIAEDFLLKKYDLVLDIPITINGRLRRAMGGYIRKSNEPHSIELARFLIVYGAREAIIDTLYHECVHYALHVLGEPFQDGNAKFESELKRLGIGSTETTMVGVYYHFTCEKCGKDDFTSTKGVYTRTDAYRTMCCSAKMTNVRKVVYDGTEAVS